MNIETHPDSEQLTAYLLGKLSWAAFDRIDDHLADCPACRSQAVAMDLSADSFLSCLRGETAAGANETAMEKLLDGARLLVQETASFLDMAPGQFVAGCELIDAKGIAGGLGVVYKAYHPVLKDFRAIKRPRTRDRSQRDGLYARFRREVEAVGAVRHDHIVRAHDAGTDNDGPYLVMEFLDGESLNGIVSNRGQLPVPQACELMRQAALGLHAAYECGLVHRDVKPSNLMLARANSGHARVVVIDWGLVKRTREVGWDDALPRIH